MEPGKLRWIAKELAKREWYVVIERPGSPPLDWDGGVSTVNDYFSKILKNPFKINGFVFFKNKLMVDMEDHKRINNFLLEKHRTDKEYIKKLAKRMEHDCDFFRKHADSLDKEDLKLIKDFFNVYYNAIAHFRWVYNGGEVFERIVKEAIGKPLKKNFISKYNLALNEIKKEIKQNKEVELAVRKGEKISDNRIINMIDNFLKSFAWIRVFHHQGEYLDYETFMQELKDNLDVGLKEDKELNTIEDIELLRYMIFLRTHVSESNAYADAAMKPAFEKLAKKFGLKYDEITFLRQEEVIKAVNTNLLPITKQEIKNRQEKGFACINLNGEYHFISGEDLNKLYYFYDYFNKEKKEETNVQILRGTSANSGFVKGTARIITNVKEFDKFKKGDILVANSTTPNYVPIMGKAIAILTDEGGITCHAAIISREMGKPCIIGLKNATKILKNSDLIEVDADKGVVRKINPK